MLMEKYCYISMLFANFQLNKCFLEFPKVKSGYLFLRQGLSNAKSRSFRHADLWRPRKYLNFKIKRIEPGWMYERSFLSVAGPVKIRLQHEMITKKLACEMIVIVSLCSR